MINILITATNTDVGKTYTTLQLIQSFSKLGYRVGVMKPIETGVKESPADATLLLNAVKSVNPDFHTIQIKDICPYQFRLPAAPAVANQGAEVDFNQLKKAQKKLQGHCDVLLIESAGGLMTPITQTHSVIDLQKIFSATTLLISDDALGCISTLLVHQALLDQRNIPYLWCINQKSNNQSFETISLPFFHATFSRTLLLQEDLMQMTKSLLSLAEESVLTVVKKT